MATVQLTLSMAISSNTDGIVRTRLIPELDMKGCRMANPGADRKIDNIEFNVADIGRSRDFYARAFGWTFTDYGPTYSEFTDGRLVGGLTTGGPVRPGGPLVILYADDLTETQKRLEDAGAQIVKPVFAFPGGKRFHFQDPDGYELAVWSATEGK
jgi:hypothetical protein